MLAFLKLEKYDKYKIFYVAIQIIGQYLLFINCLLLVT